ncbi:fatty acid synthase alpha subunit reductase [Colletotrichum orchidophilum]|uniref:Fatty acid synthase alpha subunit reductase n=1 Tax=Colletotrichum orchidophilum TaxID=1209926 RepID=A0A1G4B4W8_9PEZI|nr:fatty acid synthase alpha subunit reductase [Colletotrichum orchidophilum]OHE96345.1 fatty acid synthase alpha subunit reductase [Colletotrichum orchidophilum]
MGLGSVLLLGPMAWMLVVCAYRLYLHPLSQYPGPWLARVTRWYSAYHSWKGDIHVDMARCHEKYGRVVRYAPDRLLFDSVQSVHDIYGHSSNAIKAKSYSALLHGAPNILTARDKKQHGKRKRIISQGLSDSKMRALEPKILNQIKIFCDVLYGTPGAATTAGQTSAAAWGSLRNMSKFCDYLAMDIMASIIFSSKYDALSHEEYRWVPDTISESNVRVGVLFQIPEWKGFLKLDKTFFPSSIKARNRFIGFITKVLSTRLSLGKREKCEDIFSSLADARDDAGEGLTLQELQAEAATLIVAGSDTTSTALACLFFYLSRCPDLYQQAAAEVRGTFNDSREICTGPKLNSCVFLRACVDEALRIVPPAGSALWREVLPGGITVDGHHVPAGYDVGVGLYAIHHNPSYFPEPEKFRPSRFLGEATLSHMATAQGKSPKSAYAPFSLGSRSCLGKGLALTELMLTMAMVLYFLDFETVENQDCPESFEVRDHVTAVKDGPMLQFRPAIREKLMA